jgi:hypothetical protein
MKNLSLDELFDLYRDTIGRCTSDIRNRPDDDILYDLFEEFDVGAWSFLHEDNLTKLHGAGYIGDEAVKLSKQIRERWITLQKQDWTVCEIKQGMELQEVFDLCDRLKRIVS